MNTSEKNDESPQLSSCRTAVVGCSTRVASTHEGWAGWVGTRTQEKQTILKCPKVSLAPTFLCFSSPSVCVCVQQLRKRVRWLPTDAFDCRRLPKAGLLIVSTSCQVTADLPSVFFSSPHPLSLLSWPSPTPETVNMLTQFQNKEGEWGRIQNMFTQRWCVVYALPNANIGWDQVAKIWATYCRCFCSHQATSAAMFYLLVCTHLIVCAAGRNYYQGFVRAKSVAAGRQLNPYWDSHNDKCPALLE